MTFFDGAILFAAALAAGALNSVAGGGSFLTFPTLLFLGVPPVPANATNTVALWPGSLASTAAYRTELRREGPRLVWLSLVSLVGGFAGAALLLITSDDAFARLIPWLLLTATAVFAFGNTVVGWLRRRGHVAAQAETARPTLVGLLAQLAISVYGGFFGGGIGILMLAALTLSGLTDVHRMNGLKNWLASCINGVAVATFVLAGTVYWPQALVMVAGAVLGGYAGASVARRLDPKRVRAFVIAVGVGLTLYFFVAG